MKYLNSRFFHKKVHLKLYYYNLGLDQKFRSISNLELEQTFPSKTLLEVSAEGLILNFPCQVLATIPIRDSNKNVLSETILKIQLKALPNTLKVKPCLKWNFIDPVWGFNQTLPKLGLTSIPIRDCTICS